MNKIISLVITIFIFYFQNQAFALAPACTMVNGEITDQYLCFFEPDMYQFKLYEIGLCETAPTAPTTTSAFNRDTGSCAALYQNNSGADLTLTSHRDISLKPTNELRSAHAKTNTNYSYWYAILGDRTSIRIDEVSFSSAKRAQNGAIGVYDGTGTICWSKDTTHWKYSDSSSNYSLMTSSACGNNAPTAGGGVVTSVWNSLSNGNRFVTNLPYSSAWSGTGELFLLNSSNKKANVAPTGPGSSGDVAKVLAVETLDSPIILHEDSSHKVGRGVRLKLRVGKSYSAQIQGTGPDGVNGEDPHDLSQGYSIRNFASVFPDFQLKAN